MTMKTPERGMSARSFEDAETGDAANFRDAMMIGWYRVGAVPMLR